MTIQPGNLLNIIKILYDKMGVNIENVIRFEKRQMWGGPPGHTHGTGKYIYLPIIRNTVSQPILSKNIFARVFQDSDWKPEMEMLLSNYVSLDEVVEYYINNVGHISEITK